jgi:hypothetical protein
MSGGIKSISKHLTEKLRRVFTFQTKFSYSIIMIGYQTLVRVEVASNWFRRIADQIRNDPNQALVQ